MQQIGYENPNTALKSAVDTPASQQQTLRLQMTDGTLAFDDTGGAGPLIVAVPGMGDLRGEYRYLVPQLQAAGYRVVTMDVRGHGGSSANWADYSAHSVGRDILALMKHLGQNKAVVIGNSFSAGAAFWAAHDAPKSVNAVVMIGPVLRDPENLPWYIRAVLAVGLGGPWRVGFWLTYWSSLFPKRKSADFDEYKSALRANLNEPGRMSALKTMVYLSKADTEAILARTNMPMLVIMGTKDADFPNPADEAKWIADKTGAQMLLVEGAGHYPQTELPEECGPAIVNFLKENGS